MKTHSSPQRRGRSEDLRSGFSYHVLSSGSLFVISSHSYFPLELRRLHTFSSTCGLVGALWFEAIRENSMSLLLASVESNRCFANIIQPE